MALIPFGRRLDELAAADPDRPAFTCDDESITRGELARSTNRLARAFAELGVGEGDFVTISLPNGIQFVEACIAAWKLGATPQPVSYRLPAIELQAIIELADPALVVGADPAHASGHPCIPAGYEPDPTLSDEPLPDAVAPSFKATTSGGSTGRPKLIVAHMPGEFQTEPPYPVKQQPEKTIVAPGPLYHNSPFGLMAFGLLLGNHVVMMRRFDPETTLALVDRHRADLLYLVPTMMLRIWRLPEEVRNRYDLSSLRIVWHMASPCPAWLKREWIDWIGGERLWELYGGTEGQAATELDGVEWLAHPGSVGRCVRGEMKVVGPDGSELPPGEIGEIYMRSKDGTVNYHYIGAEARELDGWQSLGDIGWKDADGYYYLADRRTDLILSGGANIYPAEVEAAIDEHPLVLSSAVIGLPDEDMGQKVHAIVQTSAPVSEAELLGFLSERLVKYKLPRSIEFTDEPLRDDAGKVRRQALRDARVPATS